MAPFREWTTATLGHYFTSKPSRFHTVLANELATMHASRGIRRAILAPRGAAKSTWATCAYPLYTALYGIEPYTIITSDTSVQAEGFLRSIRDELMGNAELQRRHPHAVGRGPEWRSGYIKLRNGSVIEALGTGTKIRGRKAGPHRPSLIIVDDPQNKDHVVSKLQRDRSWDWLTKDVLNAGSPTTNVLVLGTALHRDAIVCKLQATPGWDATVWRSIEKWPERMDLWGEWENRLFNHDDPNRAEESRAYYDAHKFDMDRGAVVLWPDREPLYSLMLLRAAGGRIAFECEKQNNPINPEACEFPEEYFTVPGFRFEKWPDNIVLKVMSLDPSKGRDARRGDYSAIAYVGVEKTGVVHADMDLQRRPTTRIVEDFVAGVVRFRPHACVVEANQYQELLAGELQREAERREVSLPLFLVENTVSKLTRIRRLEPWLSQRLLRFKQPSGGSDLTIQQLRDFPNGDHDDGPDGLDMAVQRANDMLLGRAA